MRSAARDRARARLRRHRRIRKKVSGTGEVPRLCIFRSTNHIYAQIINDDLGVSLCSASTMSKELAEELAGLKKSEKSKKVGFLVARIAREKGIEKVTFDRGGYLYHGRVRALAEGAREGELKF